nr:HEAT repeat domain-containing protein [Spirochaetota bacterium]
MKLKMFFLFIIFIFFSYNLISDETDDGSRKIEEILLYGIESEIIAVLKEIGNEPKEEIYSTLFSRYKDSILVDTKISFVDYFSNVKNLPPYLLDALYNDASSDLIERRLKSSLLNCLGKKGALREGLFLLASLDNYDNYIKNIASDAIAKMKLPELGKPLLDRIILSDEDENKYLNNDIKTKLIPFFGENKTIEAVPYLKKIVESNDSDKYLKNFSMVALLKIGDLASIEIIAENLKDTDNKIQEYAAYSLSLFKDPAVLPHLKRMLLHNNENVRVFAIQGI